ncbi:MAG: CinA family protein [Asticcacaulis sp.]
MDSHKLAVELVALLKSQNKRIATVESCTGGLIAGAITGVTGSSEVFDYGFVTYSNAAKTTLVGVPEYLLDTHGAVSEQVAAAMAEGALLRAGADLALSVTGIAGPGGGSAEKPVGMVWFGLCTRDPHGKPHSQTRVRQFGDTGRANVRETSVLFALQWAIDTLKSENPRGTAY